MSRYLVRCCGCGCVGLHKKLEDFVNGRLFYIYITRLASPESAMMTSIAGRSPEPLSTFSFSGVAVSHT